MVAESKEETGAKTEDAATDAAAAEGEAGTGGFNAKKIILFVVLPLLILVGGVVAAYFTGHLDSVLGKGQLECTGVTEGDEDYEACQKQMAEALKNQAVGVFIDVPDMIVNLSDSSTRQPRFLKISLKVELENAEQQKDFETVMPRVVDQFQTYLRELRMDDLRGSSGMYRMKIELLNRVRAAAPETKIRDVLFQEILIQ